MRPPTTPGGTCSGNRGVPSTATGAPTMAAMAAARPCASASSHSGPDWKATCLTAGVTMAVVRKPPHTTDTAAAVTASFSGSQDRSSPAAATSGRADSPKEGMRARAGGGVGASGRRTLWTTARSEVMERATDALMPCACSRLPSSSGSRRVTFTARRLVRRPVRPSTADMTRAAWMAAASARDRWKRRRSSAVTARWGCTSVPEETSPGPPVRLRPGTDPKEVSRAEGGGGSKDKVDARLVWRVEGSPPPPTSPPLPGVAAWGSKAENGTAGGAAASAARAGVGGSPCRASASPCPRWLEVLSETESDSSESLSGSADEGDAAGVPPPPDACGLTLDEKRMAGGGSVRRTGEARGAPPVMRTAAICRAWFQMSSRAHLRMNTLRLASRSSRVYVLRPGSHPEMSFSVMPAATPCCSRRLPMRTSSKHCSRMCRVRRSMVMSASTSRRAM